VVSSPVVSARFALAVLSRRVYTFVMILGLTAVLGCRAPAPSAQARFDAEQMTKGPASAPVTIVEYSDYQ
jgi:hypothetical protein